MIISVVFVSMMVVFVTVYHFVTKPKKQQEKIYSAMTTDELIRFVQSMHCELVKRIDADAIIIGFQGGYFHLLREKTGQNIQLYYKDFYAFYLSIKKRGELLLSSFVISILIIPK